MNNVRSGVFAQSGALISGVQLDEMSIHANESFFAMKSDFHDRIEMKYTNFVKHAIILV